MNDREHDQDHEDTDSISISSTPCESLGTFQGDSLHTMPFPELEKKLETNLKTGLTKKEAHARLLRDGPNQVKPPRPKYFKKILGYFLGGFCWLLWIAAIIVFLAWEPLGQPPQIANLATSMVIIIVIFFQAGFTAYQDWSSSKIMQSITNMIPHFVVVIRDGEKVQIPVFSIVKGDIVEIQIGGKIGADVRIIETNGLKIDKSILTGESVPVTANLEATNSLLADSANVALMGTTVVEGAGLGVVLHTGGDTLMGQVAMLANKSHLKRTILQREIIRFTTTIALLAIVVASFCMIIWAAWLRVSYPNFLNLSNMLSTDMGVVVSFVPEGFPIAVTLILTIIARRMKLQKILVKSLTIVETLGCVNVVCSDKTGTLTTNMMTVVKYSHFTKSKPATITEEGKEQESRSLIHSIAHLCNAASFEPNDMTLAIPARRVLGDSTDAALLRFAAQSVDVAAEKARFKQLHVVPFNSKTKYMVTIYEPKDSDEPQHQNPFAFAGHQGPFLLMKGAPEALYKYCKFSLDPSTPTETKEFGEKEQALMQEMQESWSSQALRVLLFAYRPLDRSELEQMSGSQDPNIEFLLHDLILIGFIGIVDPPREETAGVVETCRKAGIRFLMVTGDFPLTAAAIAKNVGIFKGPIHQADELMSQPKPLHVEESQTRAPPFSLRRWVRTHFRRTLASLRVPGGKFDEVRHEYADYRFVKPEKRRFKGTGLLLTGPDVAKLEDHHWDLIDQYEEVVFARTTPEQKYTIVKQLQKRKNVVAVTGDGVNDAPALKNAHIGIGMGSGSEAAMEAASMVLMDSNFSSIVNALRQGRVTFENLKKVSLYLLPGGTFSEVISVLTNIFLGLPTPLSSFLMIFISVSTDVYPALSLMQEEAEADVLVRRPRRIGKDRLVDWKLLFHAYIFLGTPIGIVAHFLYFLYFYRVWGVPPGALFLAFDKWGVEGYAGLSVADQVKAVSGAQCVYFVTIVMLQLFGNLVNTRNRHLSMFQSPPTKNPYIFVAMVCSISTAALVIYVPFFNSIISTYPIPAEFWFLPLPFALYMIATDEIRKYVLRKYPQSWVARCSW